MKDVKLGAVIFWYIENNPNIRPMEPPTNGPSKIAPIITGMCIIVKFITGRWMIPKGVSPRKIDIPPSIPIITSFRVFDL